MMSEIKRENVRTEGKADETNKAYYRRIVKITDKILQKKRLSKGIVKIISRSYRLQRLKEKNKEGKLVR